MQLFRNDNPMTPSWDLLMPALKLLRETFWPVFYLAFLPSLVTIVGLVLVQSTIVPGTLTITWGQRNITGAALLIGGSFWMGITYPGLLLMQLDAIRGKQPEAFDCFRRGIRRAVPLLVTVAIGIFVVSAGLMALLIPGLILLRGLYLAQYYQIDQKMAPMAALQTSYEASKSQAGYIWGTIGILIVFRTLAFVVSSIPLIGYLLSIIVGLLYMYGPALRYVEITASLPVKMNTDKTA